MTTNFITKFLSVPSTNINYNFIVSIYAFFSILCGLFYTLETQVFIHYASNSEHNNNNTANDENDNESMKELAESTKGLYVIFIPFIPCFFWSLMIRSVWKKAMRDDDDGAIHKNKKE
jgi:hypothetical protein